MMDNPSPPFLGGGGELSITLLSKSHTYQILSAIMRPLISTPEVPAYHFLRIM